MSMWLTGTAMLTRIEECEQPSGSRVVAILPGFKTGVGKSKVVFFEDISLRLVGRCGEDEVVGDDGVFVQDKIV